MQPRPSGSNADVWAAIAEVRDWWNMQKNRRPLLVDLADGPCDICSEFQKGCQICGAISPMRPDHDRGWYVSPEEHFHITMFEGIAARVAIAPAVCVNCYRKAFAEIYPDQPCPI